MAKQQGLFVTVGTAKLPLWPRGSTAVSCRHPPGALLMFVPCHVVTAGPVSESGMDLSAVLAGASKEDAELIKTLVKGDKEKVSRGRHALEVVVCYELVGL